MSKAKRDLATLRTNLNADTVFNFFVTAYHVMDYVKQLGTVDRGAISRMYADPDFDMCRFICNRGKHLAVRDTPAVVQTIEEGGTVEAVPVVGQAEPRFYCDGEATPVLIQALRHESREMRGAAAAALGSLVLPNPGEMIAALERVARHDKDRAVRTVAQEAIEKLLPL